MKFAAGLRSEQTLPHVIAAFLPSCTRPRRRAEPEAPCSLPAARQWAHSGGSSPEPGHSVWQAMPGCKEYSCPLAGGRGLFTNRTVNLSHSQLAIYYELFSRKESFHPGELLKIIEVT